jgi:hypothetical protein
VKLLRSIAQKRTSNDRSQDELREQRLERIKDAVEQFTFGLGLIMAGQPPDFSGVVAPGLCERVHSALAPFRDSGELMRPDFGAYAELRVDGDLLDIEHNVKAVLEFEDRSMCETHDGRLLPVPRRRVRITMSLRLEPCVVEDCTVALGP